MRDEALSDVLKVWIYAVACAWLGAWVSPLLYNAGKALAEVSAAKETNPPLRWLAEKCHAADFPYFFAFSVGFAAVVLFVPAVEWLRAGRASEMGKVGSLRLPEGARHQTSGQRLIKNPNSWRHAIGGFCGVVLIFSLLAGALILADIFEWRVLHAPLPGIVIKVLVTSTLLAAIQELLFRSIAMGIFLRAMRPAAALGMSAVLFALVHFLFPSPSVNVLDPEASGVGFEMLRKIAGQFSELRVILGVMAPLLALGGVLAYARWKTASLWLPIGLNAGWIFINDIIAHLILPTSRPDSMIWVLTGSTLKQGFVPLVGILIAGGFAIRFTTPANACESPV